MNKKKAALDLLLSAKLLPLYYHESADVSLRILNALYAGGVRIVEYTNRGDAALKNFKILRKFAKENMPGLMLGIGTIKNKKLAEQFIKAGAEFIVCPSVNVEVGEVANDAKVLWIPGCMTATEIAVAENEGATLVKIFPGNILGPGYITSIRDIFPKMKFMPTGGVEVSEENLNNWFRSGVVAVGMGSKLITRDLIEQEDFKTMQMNVKNALVLIKKCSII